MNVGDFIILKNEILENENYYLKKRIDELETRNTELLTSNTELEIQLETKNNILVKLKKKIIYFTNKLSLTYGNLIEAPPKEAPKEASTEAPKDPLCSVKISNNVQSTNRPANSYVKKARVARVNGYIFIKNPSSGTY
jgi:uncharacterized coiled-coil protein SlyX